MQKVGAAGIRQMRAVSRGRQSYFFFTFLTNITSSMFEKGTPSIKKLPFANDNYEDPAYSDAVIAIEHNLIPN